MSDRTEAAIAFLVLAAAGLALGAPLLGRLELPRLADAAMAGAALCGLAAFAVVGLHTVHAARRGGSLGAPTRGGPEAPKGRDS